MVVGDLILLLRPILKIQSQEKKIALNILGHQKHTRENMQLNINTIISNNKELNIVTKNSSEYLSTLRINLKKCQNCVVQVYANCLCFVKQLKFEKYFKYTFIVVIFF